MLNVLVRFEVDMKVGNIIKIVLGIIDVYGIFEVLMYLGLVVGYYMYYILVFVYYYDIILFRVYLEDLRLVFIDNSFYYFVY